MTKNDIVSVISHKTGLTREVVSVVMEEMNYAIIRALKKGDLVKISGFGTFYPQDKQARKAKNPRTGEIIDIPSKKVTKFRPGKNTKILT
jgi:nucleoid DNA-binding protein